MILGVGIDIVKVERVFSLYQKGIASKFFTICELEYCESKGVGLACSLAARFAAKEALVKALGCGFVGLSPSDIEISNNLEGRPFVNCGLKLQKVLEERGVVSIHLSLSHEKDFAVANVVLEGEGVR
ncbi:MAG: holo-ACP synthase [Spirochaetales bacterium]|nr:holo-ACP synthase [Spirochaetales bacterium]